MRAAGAWCCAVFVVTGCTSGMNLAGDIGDRDRVTPDDGADAESAAEDDAVASCPDAGTGSDGRDVPLSCGNGALDPDEECDGDPPRICARPGESCGLSVCRADCLWSTCGPAGEICNGHDDDCDGATDEGAWCRVHPLPSARDLRSAWAVGGEVAEGSVLHWDGRTWTASSYRPGGRLTSVWAAAADDVWVLGENGIHHWDGCVWSRDPCSPSEDLVAVWGVPGGAVWAVGTGGAVVRRGQ